MTAFLVDTNVVSEIVRPAPDQRVLKFLSREDDIWLSVVTLHELSYGAARVLDPIRRERLTAWVASIKSRFKGRLIAVDEAIAELAGRARALAAARGYSVAPLDAFIAATAQNGSMTLATRNLRDFVALDVVTFDPWSA